MTGRIANRENDARTADMKIPLTRYALLCGSAPEDFRQKKLVAKYDSLVDESGYEPGGIVVFPNGVHELLLESVLNGALDAAPDELLLYFCTMRLAAPDAEVVRLGTEEIRRDVIAYYAVLAEELGVRLRVEYEADAGLVSEESLGYERVG